MLCGGCLKQISYLPLKFTKKVLTYVSYVIQSHYSIHFTNIIYVIVCVYYYANALE